MFGIIFIYFIGKYFYRLAEDFKKNLWLYAILGVVVYYATSVVLGVILFVIVDIFNSEFSEGISESAINLIAIPFGLGGCYLYYKYLEKKWKSEEPNSTNEIDQIGQASEN